MASRLIFLVLFFFIIPLSALTDDNILVYDKSNNQAQIIILDKVTSKKTNHSLNIGKIKIINDLRIKITKCVIDNKTGSSDIYAFLQVQDQTKANKDIVYIYNGWMINKYPSVNPFEHANYDLWIENCY